MQLIYEENQNLKSEINLKYVLIKSQRINHILMSTSDRISSRGHIDSENSCMAYRLAESMPLCLCGPIGDTTGVSIWQAFNQSTMPASYKHWINIDALHFHSQRSHSYHTKTADEIQTFSTNIQRSCRVQGKIMIIFFPGDTINFTLTF